MAKETVTYQDAGVNIDEGNRAVDLIKKHVKKTWRPEVLGELGGFGGLFSLPLNKYKEPVLVAGTDGVGTKLKVAILADKHDTIGIDAVAMCVNDILVQGAEPLFFFRLFSYGQNISGKSSPNCRGCSCWLSASRVCFDWRRNG